MKSPRISVIMGIYNCEETLAESLESLITQTYKNFQLVICDDGSTDSTVEIVNAYKAKYSSQIIILKNKRNMGLNYTLNKCLKHASGEFIARMDGDDISLPERFEKQVDFLEKNPEIDIVSTSMLYFDNNSEWGRSYPKKTPVKSDLIKRTPFAHAPCMVRKEAYEAVGGYSVDSRLLRVEDYHLWVKMYSMGFKGYNLQTPLYKMRNDQNAINRRNFKGRLNEAYVKYIVYKKFNLPFWHQIYVLKPLVTGILPRKTYELFHRRRLAIK